MPDPVVGFQIAAQDPATINSFYASMFDWKVNDGPHENVFDVDTGTDDGINGDVIGRGDLIPDYVAIYVAVEDVATSQQRCLELGGQVIRPPFLLPNGRELGIIADPEGHVVILMKKAAGADTE